MAKNVDTHSVDRATGVDIPVPNLFIDEYKNNIIASIREFSVIVIKNTDKYLKNCFTL